MPRVVINLEGVPLFNVGSYARRGSHRRDRLASAEVELVARTVRRAPEVMVKVLTRGGLNLGAVRRHFGYLDRGGELEIETDDGRRLQGKGVGDGLIEDWELDLEKDRRTPELSPQGGRKPPKLVHKLLFSMPAGTPPEKVLEAVKNFAREEFALKHRYALVLHTDEPHPHVHMVVKPVSEQGRRLNIRKATLRAWRSEFARHLRALGVAANATDRQARGQIKPQKPDGIYRAALRGASTHWRRRASEVARDLASGTVCAEPGRSRVVQTREEVVRGWGAVAADLELQGHLELAREVRRFVARMPPAVTEREWMRNRMLEHVKEREPSREMRVR